MQITQHAQKRCAQRNIDEQALKIVLRYGRKLHRTGVIFYFLGWSDLPLELRKKDHFARLQGTTLLVSKEGELITAYRDRTGWRKIRKKSKGGYRHTGLLPSQ